MSEATDEVVTFTKPFRLPGMDEDHQPGTFRLTVERSELDVPWSAYRSSITILLPRGNAIESWAITRADLDAALLRDNDILVSRGAS